MTPGHVLTAVVLPALLAGAITHFALRAYINWFERRHAKRKAS